MLIRALVQIKEEDFLVDSEVFLVEAASAEASEVNSEERQALMVVSVVEDSEEASVETSVLLVDLIEVLVVFKMDLTNLTLIRRR